MPRKSTYIREGLPNGVAHGPEVVFDQNRARTAWFEGQHVTADQFNRDQSYNITRMADLGRAVGRGVVEGFDVVSNKATTLEVGEGLGIAASGDIIHLPVDVTLDLADIPTQRRLNAQLRRKDDLTLRPETRTGLFVLAASVVEQTSNPIASYPVSLDAERSLQDSVINEAVLFTLTPVPVPVTKLDEADWQALAAYRLFVENEGIEVPDAALPLAMVALDGNTVVWVDVPMVQRQLAGAGADASGLGLVDESLRRAHFNQFDAVMSDFLADAPGQGPQASDLVRALPAMGRLPVASVARRPDLAGPMRLSQNWLPAAMPVELIALPEDEIEALLHESLHLPPIDLGAEDAVHANTPVSIVVPVPRARWMDTPAEVAEAAVPLKAPVAVGGTPTAPQDLLRELLEGGTVATPTDTLATDAWTALLAQADALWYVRRRQFQRSDLAMNGIVLPDVTPPDTPTDPPTDGPTTPPVTRPSVDLEPFIEIAFDGFRRSYSDMLADDLVETFFGGEPEMRLLMCLHQMRLKDAGALDAMLAAALDLFDGNINPRNLFEKYDPSKTAAWTRVVYGIIAPAPRLQIQPSENHDGDQVAAFISGRISMSATAARGMVRNGLPVDLRADDLTDPGKLQEVMETLLGANARFAFTVTDPFDAATNRARRRLIESRQVHRLTEMFGAVPRDGLSGAIAELRNVFDKPDIEEDALGEALVDALGGFV